MAKANLNLVFRPVAAARDIQARFIATVGVRTIFSAFCKVKKIDLSPGHSKRRTQYLGGDMFNAKEQPVEAVQEMG
ncbi:MAG: hypothetical protein V1742_04155, partial [Pseudomonadota bacterium]